jgi:hypothetical protein
MQPIYDTSSQYIVDDSTHFSDAFNDIWRYIDILRFIAWLWQIIRKLLSERPKKLGTEQPLPPTLGCNEFGYVNMSGAY